MPKKRPPRLKKNATVETEGLPEKAFEDEDLVRFKPLFGIRPGVYLAFTYGLIIFLVLFGLLFGPGLWRPGSVLVFSSEPFGAACRVDGVYRETAPVQVFVKRGKRSVEMVLPGFEPWSSEIDVPNRLFASLFFPKKIPVHAQLASSDPVAAFRAQAAEFAAWTFTGEPSVSYQVPLSLSEGAYRLGPEGAAPEIREAMECVIDDSLRFGVTRTALRDLLRAKFLVDNQGVSPSPLGLLDSVNEILAILENNPGSALWLSELLPAEAASQLAASSWYSEEILLGGTLAARAGGIERPRPANSVMLDEMRFYEIPGGTAVQGFLFPREMQFEMFYIADAEAGRALWEKFLDERPLWKPENRQSLLENGLVTEDYLADYRLPGAPSPDDGNSPVTSVSWYAARAFCDWFNSGYIPPAYSGWQMRLPREAEWEYAAGFLPEMLRNHWEWCEDDFAPLDFFPLHDAANSISPERSVKGGSWFNPADTVDAGTRASLPPETCSVFVSFRPVLARRTD